MRRRVRITLLAALVLIAVALALTLSSAPPSLAGSNGVLEDKLVSIIRGDTTVCQPHEAVPRGTIAVRLSILMLLGGRLDVEVRSHARVLTRGTLAAGWRGRVVTVPLTRLRHAATDASVCVRLGPTSEGAGLIGSSAAPAASATVGDHPRGGRIRIEYLRAGTASWWSQASAVIRRMGLGRAWAGSGIALLAVALMCTVALLVATTMLRRFDRDDA